MMLYSQILFIKKGKVEQYKGDKFKNNVTFHYSLSIYDLYNSVLFQVSICR